MLPWAAGCAREIWNGGGGQEAHGTRSGKTR